MWTDPPASPPLHRHVDTVPEGVPLEHAWSQVGSAWLILVPLELVLARATAMVITVAEGKACLLCKITLSWAQKEEPAYITAVSRVDI